MLSRVDYVRLPLKERFIKISRTEEERATALHERLPLVDLHSHIVFPHREDFDRQRVHNSGVTCFIEAVAVLSENFCESVRELGSVMSFVRKQPHMDLAFSAEDIRRAKREGKQVVMAQFEPQTIGLDLNNVTVLGGLGVRMMLLTFNTRNYIGDGCAENQDTGLSYFGFDVVRRMNEEGIMIDLSHCGGRTTLDAISASKDPVLFNHTGVRTLNPKCTRLKTEEQIKALAEKGGLMGISAVPNQLSNAKRQGIQDLLNHVDSVIKLVGVDHVAIGLDKVFGDQVANHRRMAAQGLIDPAKAGMELNAEYMEGIESPEEWPNITRGLVSRGYSDQEIEKIIGGNALRITEQVAG